MLDDVGNATRFNTVYRAISLAMDGSVEHVHTLESTLGKNLTQEELAVIGYAVLRCLTLKASLETIKYAFAPATGPGLDEVGDPKDAAKLWAHEASQAELAAYAGACVRKMSPQAKQQFKDWVAKI